MLLKFVVRSRFLPARLRIKVVVVVLIHERGGCHLLHVAETHRLLRCLLSLSENGKEDGRQNGDDGNNHQKFDKRESTFELLHCSPADLKDFSADATLNQPIVKTSLTNALNLKETLKPRKYALDET